MNEMLGTLIGLFFTLLVFSYLLGDNVLFRLAVHIFIGVSAGYVVAVLATNILWPRLIAPLLGGAPAEQLAAVVPFVLGLLLLARALPRISGLGSPVLAFLVGVGAAVVVSGAITGTLIPQTAATINRFGPGEPAPGGGPSGWGFLDAAIILVGAVATLAYFQFHKRISLPVYSQAVGWIGRVAIAITLGAVFAGVYMAALAALIERLGAVVGLFKGFL